MLPKKNRVDKKDIDFIFKRGNFVNSPNFTFKYILNNNKHIEPRISFITSKNVSKLAVKRNFLRRKGYSVLKKYINQFPTGILGVFIFRKYQDDVLIIENEIKNILDKSR
ncbi:MAG: ribonuclease P protein component [Candidatus Paceibacterota bacterium]